MKELSKICIICHPYYPKKDTGRGHDRYASELISHLKREGLRINVLDTGYSKNSYEAALKDAIFPFKMLPINSERYHAVSPMGGKTAVWLKKSPLITTVHDLLPFQYKDEFDVKWKYKYQRYCFRLSIEKSDVLIVPFEKTKETIISMFKIPPERIKIVEYGVDHEHFFPMEKDNGGEKKVFYLGEVSYSKGVDTLLKAFSLVQKEIKDSELLIGGKGSNLNSLKTLAKDIKIDNSTTFLGFVPDEDLPSYYNQADVVVFPSRYGFGLPTLEAMACGTPVIAGAHFDAPEFIGDAGILVKPGNFKELADALLKILSDDELSRFLSKKGIEKAKSLSWDRMAKETLEVYKSVFNSVEVKI